MAIFWTRLLASLVCYGAFYGGSFGKQGARHDKLDHALRYYELVSMETVGHKVVRRSAESRHPDSRIVTIHAFSRSFELSLQKRHQVLPVTTKVYEVDGDNREASVDITPDSFYTGHIVGDEEKSSVDAYWDDGEFSATVTTDSEVYVFEPAHRHLRNDTAAGSLELLAYRQSDLRVTQSSESHNHGQKFCGVLPEEHFTQFLNEPEQDSPRRRIKRQAGRKVKQTRCPLLLIADHRFYQKIGQSSLSRTLNYMVRIGQTPGNFK